MFPLILSQKPYLIQRGHEHSSPYKRGGMKRKSAGYSELLPNEKSWGVGQRSVVCDAVANERGGNSTRRGLVTCGSLLQVALGLLEYASPTSTNVWSNICRNSNYISDKKFYSTRAIIEWVCNSFLQRYAQTIGIKIASQFNFKAYI